MWVSHRGYKKTTHTDFYLNADSGIIWQKIGLFSPLSSTVHKPSAMIAYRKKYST
jgi:hypothetical protein